MKKLTSSGRRPFWFGLLTLSFTSAGLLSGTAFAQKYQETNLVSNTSQSGVTTVDSDLVNCWGISRNSTGAWWAADEAKGVATLYNGTGIKQSLTVTIPQSGQNATGAPTGIVSNGSTDFDVESGKPAVFIFAAFDGTISAWNPGANPTVAIQKVQATPGSVLTGATIAQSKGQNFLYVTDVHEGKIQGKFEDQNGNVISIPGLWGLAFGAGNANAGAPNQLFFNAGVDQDQAGFFGFFAPVATDLTQGNDQ